MGVIIIDLEKFWKDKDDMLYELAKAGSMEELEKKLWEYMEEAAVGES
jgi:hypothetical protein